jgi:two-component system NarL family sensor kinase
VSGPPGDVAAALIDALRPGAAIGVAVHDEDLRVLVISPSLAELSGTTPDEQLGRRLTEALPGEIGEIAEASLSAVAATREPLLRLEPAVEAGRERGWLIHVYPLEHEGRELVAVIALDVTESRRAHERLQEIRERLATAQRMARIGSWTWDVIADRWQWSEELYRIAGLSPADSPPGRGAMLRSIAEEDRDAYREVTAQALRDGLPYEMSFSVLLPDGDRRIVRGRGVPERGESGAVERIHGFAQDVTELARATSRQRTAARLGRLALSGVTFDVLMREAADAVAGELGLDFVGIAQRREEGGPLVVRALSGGGAPAGRIGEEIDEHSLTAKVLRDGETVIVPDWAARPDLPRPMLAAELGMRSSAAVPIGPREAPIGVLSGHSAAPDRVGEEDAAFMTIVANVLASAQGRLLSEAEVTAQSEARGRLVALALDAEDRARRGISEALHDGPLQDLLALGHEISRLRPAAEGDEEHLRRVHDGLARAVTQIRDVMLDLHPVQLQVGGLESALRAICAQQAATGGYACRVEIAAEASERRDELVLSLARELLRNAAKHAGASVVDVRVAVEDGAVRLDVIDDGSGFDPERLAEALGAGHIGLASSRERAEAIGGSFRVGPREDGERGTQAVALLPS